MDLSLFFAGTGGSVPSARRGLPAVLVRRGGDRLLFDCAEGTQRQLMRSVGLLDLDAVFITHFHADHWLGLPGMLKSFALREREAPLTVYGPSGLGELMEAMRIVYGRLPYELSIVELDAGRDGRARRLSDRGHPRAPSRRPVVRLRPRRAAEARSPRRAAGRAARRQAGPRLRPAAAGGDGRGRADPSRSWAPTREGRKVVLSGDTAPCEALAIASHQADVLVHEATFAEEESERASQTLHSTARQAAELARDAEVRLLALTHVSSRYAGGELRDEARAVFAATEALRDFDTIEVPFPERGGATLVRWSERKAALEASAQAPEQSTRARAAGRRGHRFSLIHSACSFNPVP